MTNRTDWPELARELQDIFGFNGEARRRIETELHNAFVAGQEAEGAVTVTLKLEKAHQLCADDYPKSAAGVIEGVLEVLS